MKGLPASFAWTAIAVTTVALVVARSDEIAAMWQRNYTLLPSLRAAGAGAPPDDGLARLADSGDRRGQYFLAYQLARTGRAADALAIHADSDQLAYDLTVAGLHECVRNGWSACRPLLERATELAPTYSTAAFYVGRSLQEQQPAEALRHYRQALASDRFDARFADRSCGRAAAAFRDLGCASARQAEYRIGETLLAMRDWDAARKAAVTLIDHSPQDATGHFLFGRVSYEAAMAAPASAGNDALGDAIKALEHAVELDPGGYWQRIVLGRAYRERSQLEPAHRQFEAAAAIDQKSAAARLEIGITDLRLGAIDAAVQNLERAAAAAPSEPGIRVHLGDAYAAGGRAAAARTAYLEALTLSPDFQLARERLAALEQDRHSK